MRSSFATESEYIDHATPTFALLTSAVQASGMCGIFDDLHSELAGPSSLLKLVAIDEIHR